MDVQQVTDETTVYCHCGSETSYPEFTCCLVCRCDEHAMGYCGPLCAQHPVETQLTRLGESMTRDIPRDNTRGRRWVGWEVVD